MRLLGSGDAFTHWSFVRGSTHVAAPRRNSPESPSKSSKVITGLPPKPAWKRHLAYHPIFPGGTPSHLFPQGCALQGWTPPKAALPQGVPCGVPPGSQPKPQGSHGRVPALRKHHVSRGGRGLRPGSGGSGGAGRPRFVPDRQLRGPASDMMFPQSLQHPVFPGGLPSKY